MCKKFVIITVVLFEETFFETVFGADFDQGRGFLVSSKVARSTLIKLV